MSLLSSVDAIEVSPVDAWIVEQADLTAVERFSQRHDGELAPRQARYYRDLIPGRGPARGEQYAFAVDLDACTGCKACVAACHSLNGLDDDEAWREVTLLAGERGGQPFQQHVTAACHHCVDPACMHGCPVDAYEKDPLTGIVTHLDDQCIGCSYCTLTCPYEVPVYDHRRGIVRKCDMCTGRLEVGEAPACVQGCPNEAITITIVDIAATVAASVSGALVPGAPPSSITSPSTQYRSVHPPAGRIIQPAVSPSRPARSHPQLTVMLVLTQLAVGTFVVDLLLRWFTNRGVAGMSTFDAVVAIAAGFVALGASVFHLGRPWLCYRAIIGVGHSWLSREVLAFGLFTGLALPYALLLAVVPGALGPTSTTALGASVALTGIVGVACSVLIYTRTRRTSWRTPAVAAKFALTAAVCGVATVLWASAVSSAFGVGADGGLGRDRSHSLLLLLAALVVVKLAGEATVFGALGSRSGAGDPDRERRARLLTGVLRPAAVRRYAFGVVGGIVLPVIIVLAMPRAGSGWMSAALMTAALGALVAGELIERTLFFTTASAPQ